MDKELKGQGIPFDPILDEDLSPSTAARQSSISDDTADKKKKKSSGSPFVTVLLVIFLLAAVSGGGYIYYLKEQEKSQRVKVESQLSELREEHESMTREIEVLSVAKNQLEIDLKRERDNYSLLRSQYQQQEEEHAKLKNNFNEKMEQIASLKTRLTQEEQESKRVAAKIESIEHEYDEVKRQLSQIRMAKEALENKLLQINRDKEARSSVELERIVVKDSKSPVQPQVAAATVSVPTTSAYTALPNPGRIEGQVLVVNREFAFVVVNVGQKDGLKETELMQVYRGTQNIGQVQVERVYDTMSSAVIMNTSAPEIQEGDIVRIL